MKTKQKRWRHFSGVLSECECKGYREPYCDVRLIIVFSDLSLVFGLVLFFLFFLWQDYTLWALGTLVWAFANQKKKRQNPLYY